MLLGVFSVLLLLCSPAALFTHSYEGYKVYDIRARHKLEKQLLLHLYANGEYDFFVLPRALNEQARVMVQPQDQAGFEQLLQKYGLEYIVFSQNVGESLKLHQMENQMQIMLAQHNEVHSIGFKAFHRYAEINAYLHELASAYPGRVSVQGVGKSYEQRELKTLTITNGDGRPGKQVVFLDAGLHAREWIAPAAALYVIHQLVENLADNWALLRNFDWVVLPLVNPDGYEYTHTSRRLWRKTRKPASDHCSGTDANRNFDFHWGEAGASAWPCDNTYMGETPFSEPEAQAVRDVLLHLATRGQFYLSLHSYGNFLLYPWSWANELPASWQYVDEVARAGAAAIKAATGSTYRVGSSTNVLYPAAGCSVDYAFAVANFSISIGMELPAGGSGFDPSTAQIQPFVHEAWLGIKAMVLKLNKE